MKLKLAIATVITIVSFQSCQKCVTCTPYRTATGVVSTRFQSVKSCSKVDVAAYEKGPFMEQDSTPVVFHCK